MTAAVNLAHVNGVDIEYVEQGEGPPLVFVHGYISDHRVWDDQIRLFSRHHKVIAPSQRYFGTRQWRDRGERFSPSTHVDDLAALIRKLGVAPAHIVGWSYGAALALALAVRHPDCVGSLFAYEPGVTTFVEDPEEVRIVTEDRHDMVGAPGPEKPGRLRRGGRRGIRSRKRKHGPFRGVIRYGAFDLPR